MWVRHVSQLGSDTHSVPSKTLAALPRAWQPGSHITGQLENYDFEIARSYPLTSKRQLPQSVAKSSQMAPLTAARAPHLVLCALAPAPLKHQASNAMHHYGCRSIARTLIPIGRRR